MSHYAFRGREPVSLTADEQEAVLRAAGEHVRGFRDYVLILTAMGTGLREHELVALDVADVLARRPEGRGRGRSIGTRWRLRTFKGHRRRRGFEVVLVPDEVRRALERYLRTLPTPTGPLFRSRERRRLSTRQVRHLWRVWQGRAGVGPHPFHALRHTFVSNVIAAGGGDIELARRLARHRRVETTQLYAHVPPGRLELVRKGLRAGAGAGGALPPRGRS